MLGMSKYPKSYIDDCRARVDADVSAFKHLAAAAGAAVKAFEPHFFNNLVLALDAYFVHRVRMLEGKDGNPLNEVRLLCNSLMLHGGILTADKQIKLSAETSVLGYELGDEIAVGEEGFSRLSAAFFAEIESKYL
jgi:hypothetical protein